MQPQYTRAEFDACASRQILPLSCKHCSKTFYRTKHFIEIAAWNKRHGRKHAADFCSIKCHNIACCPPTYVNCEQCHKRFRKDRSDIRRTKHNFCSRSCAGIWHSAHKTTGTRSSKLECWLQHKLVKLYPGLEFHFNRTDAINGELDIYIPALKLAFELNGVFHYEPIYGNDKLAKIQTNDSRKYRACYDNGIELCVIDVSHQKYFKEQSATPFLAIIQQIIKAKSLRQISSESGGRTQLTGL